MADDLFDEFIEYDFTMGADVVKFRIARPKCSVVFSSITRSSARSAGKDSGRMMNNCGKIQEGI